MKNILFAALAVLFLTSCNEDFATTDKWKDIPIVYGLLNMNDTAHYIRVERAFVDPDKSASEIAQIPDSLYYDDIVVTMKVNGVGEFIMQPVNGEDEGHPRDADGPFASVPNRLYKIKQSQAGLATDKVVTITVKHEGSSTPLTTVSMVVVGNYEILLSSTPVNLNFASSETNIAWRAVGSQAGDKAAKFYDLRMRINYNERSAANPTWAPKSVEWILDDQILRAEEATGGPAATTIFKQVGTEFYRFLATNLEISQNIERDFTSIDILVGAGGDEIYQYISRNQANTGITGTQQLTPYTNLSYGLGVVSSINKLVVPGFSLNDKALDSLVNGSITRDLNFLY